MTLDYPPAYLPPQGERTRVEAPIQVTRSHDRGVDGIHLVIDGQAYFIERHEARRVARHILFDED